MAEFEVYVRKENFKFNCAHFIVFDGFRERLHGHNYQLSVKVVGHGQVGPDGYLIDFGDIKKTARALCHELNEHFIVPAKTPFAKLTEDGTQLCMECVDGSRFSFPKGDCAMLPIEHSSAEELCHYFWCAIIRYSPCPLPSTLTPCTHHHNRKLGLQKIQGRGINTLEIGVAEAIGQVALYRRAIPVDEAELVTVENTVIVSRPQPCFREE